MEEQVLLADGAYAIIERGRGPEIAESRITVYDVLVETGWGSTSEQLARDWQLTVPQIELALRYIAEHREEVERNWAAIKARNAQRRAEYEAKNADLIAASRGKAEQFRLQFLAQRKGESDAAGAAGGHQHPGSNGAAETPT